MTVLDYISRKKWKNECGRINQKEGRNKKMCYYSVYNRDEIRLQFSHLTHAPLRDESEGTEVQAPYRTGLTILYQAIPNRT